MCDHPVSCFGLVLILDPHTQMCQNPVGSGTVSKACHDVANLASSIIRGGSFLKGQNQGVFGVPPNPSTLVVIVEKTDSKDTKYADCGEPTVPCKF